MSERRAGAKGRRLGSSRRRQVREGSGETPATAPDPTAEPPQTSEIVQRAQDFLREQHKDQKGFITRSDVKKFQEEGFPCSTEELELVFDGLDAAGTGRLSTEEFTAGLRQFLSSQKAAREHQRKKTASRRVRLVIPNLALEGVDSEEQRHFAAFMDQLGTNNISEEQEIWQLWVKLRQDEPQLLDNLEDFLAKMRHRIQEARSKKEALEVTLNKRVAEHDKEVQQLCEVLEQQIQQEQQRLEQQSMARSQQHFMELQRVLDASEREVQRLVTAQMELERRCRSLHSTQQVTSTENRELQESNRVLEDHLQHLHQQLQQTQGHLRTMRTAVAGEHAEEPGDRAVTELPSEMPMSPQMSPGTSEKFRSEMRIRLGSQSREGRAKNTHQVVWEVLPAEISISGAPARASSAEEDPFPELLKEERFSDQSSLLREMNDAIAALSKHLKAQAPDAPLALADTATHSGNDAEPQTGPEAATAHGTTPGILQETLPGHISHELFEGDLKEGPATAELCALDVAQAGASMGPGHHVAQEPGTEQGESPEEPQGMLFLQGKGAGVKEMVPKVPENLGETKEAGELAVMEVEGARWMQEKTGWGKAQLLAEAEEAGISQGESLEAGLGPPEAGKAGLAVGQCLGMEGLEPEATPGKCVQAPGVALQKWAGLSLGLSGKLEIELGEHLEPEPESWGEVQMGAAPRDSVLLEGSVQDEEEERVIAEVQPQGEPLEDAEVLPARAEQGMGSRASGEEEEGEETQPREADVQLQGEPAREDTGWGGSAGAEAPLGADVEVLEAQDSGTNVQLLAEVEADLQASREAGSPGTEQGGSVDPGVQQLEEEDEPQLGLEDEKGAAEVHSEGPSPVETPAGSPDLCGLFPVKSQTQELVKAEDAQTDVQLRGSLSPETCWGVKDGTAAQAEEEKDVAQGQDEPGLPQEPVLDPYGAAAGQGEGSGDGVQPQEEAESLETPEDQSSHANVQLLTEVDELTVIPGGNTDADLQPPSETGSLETEQGGSADPDVQPLEQVDKAELEEMLETEKSWIDTHMGVGASPETPRGGEMGAAMELGGEAEDGRQRQGESGLPQEPVPDPYGVTTEQGEGAAASVQPWKEIENLDTTEDQSTGTNVQLLAGEDELKLTPGESTEAHLQLLDEAGSPGAEQGGGLDPDVQPLSQVDEQELVEMEAENAQTDVQLHRGLNPGAPWGGEGGTAIHTEGEEDGAQGQGECELPQEPVLGTHGAAIRQGEEAEAAVQLWEEAGRLDTVEDQSSDANVQLFTELDELTSASGESTEAELQLLSKTDSLGTEQGGRVDPDVQLLDQVDEVEMEAENAKEDTTLSGGLNPEGSWGGKGGTAIHTEEEEDGAQGQDECELPQEPVLGPHGPAVGQGEGAGGDIQPQEKAERLTTLEDQSTDANMQLLTEVDELTLKPEGSTEADLQLSGKTDSLRTEQGGSVDPGMQPLDQVDKGELVEMETEDSRMYTQLCGGASTETPQEQGDYAALQLGDEAEDGGQGQGEPGLLQDPVLDPQGARARQGAGTAAGVQPGEEAEHLGTLEGQSTSANTLLVAEEDELKSASGGSAEADLASLGAAGMWEGEQGLIPGLRAGLCVAPTADTGEGPAAAPLPPPAEADSYPEPVTAAEGLGLEAKLGPPTGPDGQTPEDTEAPESPQGEKAAAGGRPLDGAQGLEGVQGERLEARTRSAVETKGLGLHQGHADGVSAPACPVSDVPLQTGTLWLETMMQEDVLIPDVWRLCASGQAAQSELQEQVSAQGHQVKIHTPAQRPEGKTPHVMEPEQTAAGAADPPKQEVPPVPAFHMRVRTQEDAGNNQQGMVLTESSPGDTANLCVQPQRQLLGEQSEDPSVDQREKPQEFGLKMSQEGEPGPEEPKAVTADGAEAAPEGCPKAPLDPDHLYNVLFIGDSHVGKTSFLYRLHADSFNPNLTATVGLDYQVKNLIVDNKRFALRLWDSAGQERYHSMTKQFFRKADGVVLMYDITSQYSYSNVRYWLSCIQEAADDGIAILLLGNKTDCTAKRQVPTREGECLAKEHQLMFYECSAASGHNVSESMVSFIRLLKVREDEFKNKAEEVPKAPQKKKSCCW